MDERDFTREEVMKQFSVRSMIRVISVAVLCGASTVHAGLFRTYLSLNGNDANPCTVQLPCRLLPAALAAVNDGGEIWMIDSANFNTAPVSITKSVKILAIPGQMGSVVGNGGDAIDINTSGDVTLRNLQILNFSGGVDGINIANAGAVHIEKTSIDGFTNGSTACIHLDSSSTVRLYIDDSFVRHCNIALFVNGSNTANKTSVIVDNTRIERGFSSTPTAGVWMQGAVDVILRNTSISRQSQAIHFENPTTNSDLVIDRCEITRSDSGLVYMNGVLNAQGHMTIKNSAISGNGDLIDVSNSAVGGTTQLMVSDTVLSNGTNGVTVANSAADTNTRVFVELVRSQVKSITTAGASLNATNGAKAYLYAHDSEFAHSATAIQTSGSGAGGVTVSLVRSIISHVTTAIDHGFGEVRLDGSHVVNNANDFVNNGSGNIVSLGNNMVTDNTNASGFTYITPAIIAPK